jgi:hypothetical protein
MKKFLLLLALSIMFSCSNDSEITPVNEFTAIEIPQSFKAKSNSNKSTNNEDDFEVETLDIEVTDKDGNIAIGQIRFTMPENHGEYLHKLEITGNIFEETNLSPDFFVNQKSLKESGVLQKSSCIASCHSTYTDKDGKKISGRGWCKAGCWAKIVAAVAASVAAVAAVF